MTPEQILNETFTSVIASDGHRSLVPKTGDDHIAALIDAGYRIVPVHTPTPDVWTLEWTDERKPTAPTYMSAREAACEILTELDWERVIEETVGWRDIDPLIYAGLRSQLETINWLDPRRFMMTKWRSHLTAWVTAHMRQVSWCTNPDHHDGDLWPFEDCTWWDDDPESPCEWGHTWALYGDPEPFLRLAMTLFRDGWTPEAE